MTTFRNCRAFWLLLLAFSTVCLSALTCDVEVQPVVDEARPEPLFDLAAVSEPEGFFDYPFPSDARLTAAGAPALTTFYEPVGTTLLLEVRRAVERDIRGFSPLAGVYFRFSAPLDEGSLPGTIDESVAEGATAFLVDVDPDSPQRGRRWPAEVTFYPDGGRYWRPDTLVVRPPLAMPLRPATRYAAVVTREVRGLEEREPLESASFAELLVDDAPSGRETEWESLRPLTLLAGEEGWLDDVLMASGFTTADHIGDMRRLREWVYDNVEEPRASDWVLAEEPDEEVGYALYEGRFEMMDFLSGEPPYDGRDDGVILFDEEGMPLPGRMVSVRFALTVPLGTAPRDGWPLAVYSHGAGGSYRSFDDDEGIWAAEVGVAMLSMDNPMNGERDPEGGDFVQYLTDLAMQNMNVGAGRDMYRHGIVDQVQLARLATGDFAVPAGQSHTGEPIAFDTEHFAFTSHSMGSQIGTMLVGVEPLFDSAFFSEGGGGAAAAFLLRKSNDLDLEAIVALALGVDLDREPLNADHPVVGLLLQTLLDPGDPLNYAYGAIREPVGEPVHILMTEGLEDDQTIPTTIEALSAAYGLPIVEPVAQESEAHDLWGIESVSSPVSSNVDVGPNPVTGGVMQFPGHGHYAFYRSETAQDAFRAWLASAADGAPIIEFD